MNKNFLFQHGWAYDAHIWRKWLEQVPSASHAFDQNYFSSTSPQKFKFEQKNSVIITHSLGIHLLPKKALENCSLLVIIAGFEQFHSENKKKESLSRTTIKKMLLQLDLQKEEMLFKFYQRANRPIKNNIQVPKSINWKALKKDLILLNKERLDLSLLKKIPKVLLLHGEKDTIIPVEKSLQLHEKLFNSELIIISEAGHLLPLTHSEECWKYVKKQFFKIQVANNFSRSPVDYHLQAKLQKFSAQELLKALSIFHPQKLPQGSILEIGCGTGFMTESLLKKFPSHPLLISDLSPGMVYFCQKVLKEALSKHMPSVNFFIADGEHLVTTSSHSMIISAMSFQWFENLPKAMEKLFFSLKEEGILIFSYLNDQSFPEWKKAAKTNAFPYTGHPLPKSKMISKQAQKLDSNYKMIESSYPIHYKSPKDFFLELKKLGAHTNSSSEFLSRKEWISLFKSWQEQTSGDIISTYNITYLLLKRLKT